MRLPFSSLLSLPALLFCLLASLPLAWSADEEPIATTPSGISDQLKEEMEGAGPGDKREFTIHTDENIAALDVNAIYKNAQKSFFTVSKIASKGPTGGTFTVIRSNGSAEPGQRLDLAYGAGPKAIAVRLTLIDLYLQGGWALHPIAFLGICAVLLIVNCMLVYRRVRQIDPELEVQGAKLLRAGDIAGFTDLANSKRGMLAVIARAMTDRWATSSPADIKERVEIAASGYLNRLRFPVKILNLISVAAPLLGLLGTIVGMVMVFEGVAGTSGAAKAAVLAAGIRIKLFSTAFALMVAIPALFSYFLLNQRVSTLIAECEAVTERFMHRIARLKRGEGGEVEAEEDDAEQPADEAESEQADDDGDDEPAPRPRRSPARA